MKLEKEIAKVKKMDKTNYRNFPMVPRVIYGRGSFDQLADILLPKRKNADAPFIFLVDDFFKGKELEEQGTCDKRNDSDRHDFFLCLCTSSDLSSNHWVCRRNCGFHVTSTSNSSCGSPTIGWTTLVSNRTPVDTTGRRHS